MAAYGVEAISESGRRLPVIDRHRDDIGETLRAKGLPVRTDVGLSDFRVDLVIADPNNPEQPLVAVLLDGPNWHARRTVADRDGLPVDVLHNLMHWPAVERIWMPSWLQDRETTIASIQTTVEEAKQRLLRHDVEPDRARREPEVLTLAEAVPRPVASLRIASAPAAPRQPKRHPMIQVFREYVPRLLGDVTALDQISVSMPSASPRVNAAIAAVIEIEAPIHPDRLARLVANSFGLNRVNADRRRTIQRLVPSEFKRETDEQFFWTADVDPEAWRVVRCPSDGASRPVEEVSLVEIGNAMMVVAEQAGGIEAEELKREALNLFGGVRITPTIGSRLDAAVKRALTKGTLRLSITGVITSGGKAI